MKVHDSKSVLNLATVCIPAANSRGVSGSPAAHHRPNAETPVIPTVAAGGNVRSSQTLRLATIPRHPGEPEIIADVRRLVVNEILELLGNDLPSKRHYRNYLEGLRYLVLCARRDQLLHENQRVLPLADQRRKS